MRDPFANYDNWLSSPYEQMMEDDDQFIDWAEEEGYDLDDVAQMDEANQAYDDYIEGLVEANAETKYEAYLDRLEVEADEREWD